MATIELRGQVISKLTGNGIPSCLIELWTLSNGLSAYAGKSVNSNEDGSFILSGKIDQLSADNYSFCLKAKKENNTIGESPYIKAVSVLDKVVKMKIEIMPSLSEGNMMVYGLVRSSDGKPKIDYTVVAYDKSLTGQTELGRISTGDFGEYVIQFPFPPENSVKLNPDLIIKVFDPLDSENSITTSPLFISANSELRVDLSIDSDYKGATDFEKVNSLVKSDAEVTASFLNTESDNVAKSASIESLSPKEIAYLSNKISIDNHSLAVYIKALHLNLKLDLFSNENDDSVEMIYGAYKYLGSTEVEKLFFTRISEIDAAIEKAQNNNDIKSFSSQDRLNYISSIKAALVDFLSRASNTDLDNMFTSVGVSTLVAKRAILTSFTDFIEKETNDQTNGNIITDIRVKVGDPPSLTSGMVDKMEYFLTALKLTGNIQLVNKLFEESLDTVDALIEHAETQLSTIITTNSIPIPTEFNTVDEYARKIMINLGNAFPEEIISKNIINDTECPSEHLSLFFNNNPAFPFLKESVDVLFEQRQPNLIPFDEETLPHLKKDLSSLQRLCNLTFSEKRYQAIKTLWLKGMSSSQDIIKSEEGTFINDFSESFPGDPATGKQIGTYIYRVAYLQHCISLNTFANLGSQINSINPGILQDNTIHGPINPENDIPSLSDLFGSNGCYICPEGRSVLSPAAYLADLLKFKVSVGEDEVSIAETVQIKSQRPDIAGILLENKNSITRLPYIDIVNELLASVINANNNQTSAKTYNTTLEEDALRAFPEHLDKFSDAFVALSTSNYPWCLPFDYWTEESREWLKNMGVPKFGLMETFPYLVSQTPAPQLPGTGYLGDNQLTCDRYENDRISNEYLNISTIDYDELTTDFLNNLGELTLRYGGELSLLNILNLLSKTGLSFEELKDRIKSYYINNETESGRFRIVLNYKTLSTGTNIEDCDLSTAFLSYTDEEIDGNARIRILDRLYRFSRLMRCAKLSVRELDLLLIAFEFDTQEWDQTLLTKIYKILRLRDDYNLDLEQVLLWYSSFNTNQYEGVTTLYDKLFRNPTFNTGEINEYANAFDPTVQDNKPFLDDQVIREVIFSALNISEEEYYLILNREGLMYKSDGTILVSTSTVANLSKVYRVVSFCRSFAIPFSDYYQMLGLPGQAVPINHINTIVDDITKTRDFIDRWQAMQETGFSICDLKVLLSNIWNPASSHAPSEDTVKGLCRTIGQKLYDESSRLITIAGLDLAYQKEIVKKKLALLFPSNDAESLANRDSALTFIETTGNQTLPSNNDIIAKIFYIYPPTALDTYNEFIGIHTLYNRYSYVIEYWNDAADPKKVQGLRELLGVFVPKEDLNEAVTLVSTYNISWSGTEDGEYAVFIKKYFSAFTNAENAVEVLGLLTSSNSLNYTEYNRRCDFILKELIKYFVHQVLIREFGIYAGLSFDQSTGLLDHWVKCINGNNPPPSYQAFLDPAFIQLFASPFSENPPEVFSDACKTMEKLIKAGIFVKKYNITPKVCEFIATHYSDGEYNILNIFDLPAYLTSETGLVEVETTDYTSTPMNTPQIYQPTFEEWFNLDKAFKLDKKYSKESHSMFDVWSEIYNESPTPVKICQQLALTTGWNYTDIHYLMFTGDHCVIPGDYENIEWVEKLAEEIFISLKLGVSPYSIVQRNNVTMSIDDAMLFEELRKEPSETANGTNQHR
jgi:hypothetical protein